MALLASWGKRNFDQFDKDWKKNSDFKYNTSLPNILWARADAGFPFWEGVTWAMNASRTFYHWKIGNEMNIKFWHDIWARECYLETQFWYLFDICNQTDCSVA
uniref:Uncharacterized protein n=1 Tax=Hordeum vulgare subsp. vulgare TaxID=112509 RepID=A0A8I6WV88_HORVV